MRSASSKKVVTILIPTRFDSRYMLELCLETIKKYTDYPHKIIVGDAGVDDATKSFLASRKDLTIVKPEDPYMPKDSMIQYVDTPYFCFLHDDVHIMKKNWLSKRVALMEKNPKNAVVGPVVANFIYGWRSHFLYKRSMRRFWPLALLVRTDVQKELSLHWGIVMGELENFDTGGMAYQQFMKQKKYRFVPCDFRPDVRHFGNMTWLVKNKMEWEKINDKNAGTDPRWQKRDELMKTIKQILESKNF